MAGSSTLISLDSAKVWAYVVKSDEGFRVRLSLDDWERLCLAEGQRVRTRIAGRDDWLYVIVTREDPPVVWAVLVERITAPAEPRETAVPSPLRLRAAGSSAGGGVRTHGSGGLAR